MATLRIWELVGSKIPMLRVDERMNYQAVTFTGTAETSASFGDDTSLIAVIPDAACAIEIGPAPVATANSYPLLANEMVHIEVRPGAKISAITTA